MKRQTVLVTGSSGLIGTAICRRLEALGHAVRRFDIADTGDGHGDILDPAALKSAVTGCSGVIHLAAVSRVVWGERDPQKCHLTNEVGTRNVIDAVRDGGARPWMVFGSSREVYGQGDALPLREDAPLRPMNHYARTKVRSEQAMQAARKDGLHCAVIRFSTVYGSVRDHPDRVIPAFCRAAIAGLPLRVEGADNCLDVTHVSDVADCLAKVVDHLSRGQSLDPMHLTTGAGTTLPDLARMAVELADSDSEIITLSPRDFDVARFAGDPARAMAQAGWRPTVPLRTGLADMIAALRDHALG